MNDTPECLYGMKAICRVAGVGERTLRAWIAEGAERGDPFPIYRNTSAAGSPYYTYADEVLAWKRRRPKWQPGTGDAPAGRTPQVDHGRASTVTLVGTKGE